MSTSDQARSRHHFRKTKKYNISDVTSFCNTAPPLVAGWLVEAAREGGVCSKNKTAFSPNSISSALPSPIAVEPVKICHDNYHIRCCILLPNCTLMASSKYYIHAK